MNTLTHHDVIVAAMLVGILCPTAASAQPFGFGSGWDQQQTAATSAVHEAISRGLCDQAAIDVIRTLGQPAVVVNAGAAWPADRHVIMWYRKGAACSGAFQYVPAGDGGGDQGYRGGWEISWDPHSYVPGAGDASHPTDAANNDHPTAWRFTPGSAWDPSFAPTPTPVPVPTPAPVPPQTVAPPAAPLPSTDLTPVVAQLAILNAKIDALAAMEEKFHTQVADAWQRTGGFVLKYIAPAVAAIFAGRASK